MVATALLAVALMASDPRVDTVAAAIREPGCPRLHGMLTDSFQKAFPKESWAQWCANAGKLQGLQPRGEKDGWLSFVNAEVRLDLAFSKEGRVSGLKSSPSGTLASVLQKVERAHHFPGAEALVVQNGVVKERAVVGVRKADAPKSEITQGLKWHLGSDGKAMTATVAAMLVEEGKLQWSSRVGDVLPEWSGSMNPAFRRVTLEMLLAHRAGLPVSFPSGIWKTLRDPDSPPALRSRAVFATLKMPPSKVGEYVYSNVGYLVAAVMMERVAKLPFEQLLQQRLFDLLKMRSCGFGAAGEPGKVDQPWGHDCSGERCTPVEPGALADNPPAMAPAGTMHCAFDDWLKFLDVHLKGARGEPTALKLSAETIKKLHTPWPGGDYALGWIVKTRQDAVVLAHDGSNTMSYATVMLVPSRNFIFIAATNRGDREASAAMGELSAWALSEY